ncbi:MAG: hypothetical protein ACR2RV_07765 [Verrucomicrobiales bacterium]
MRTAIRIVGTSLAAAAVAVAGGIGYYSHHTGTTYLESGSQLARAAFGIESSRPHKAHGR